MKNIVIITRTLTRYYNIRRGLIDLSKGDLKVINHFFPTKTLSKFKRYQFLQVFFPLPELLIIDLDIPVGKDISGNVVHLIDKIALLGLLDKKIKILLLIKEKQTEKETSDTILIKIGLRDYLFHTFLFTENQKAEKIINPLFEKVKKILEN